MATKLSRKDVPASWNAYVPTEAKRTGRVGRRDSVERQRRIAQLRELVASGAYTVNLERLAQALIRRGGLMHGAEVGSLN